MTEAQIKHMVDRFLSWKLPANFNPDNGISATRPNYAPNVPWDPTGTNLLDATQATAMVRHMLKGLPTADFCDGDKVQHVGNGEVIGTVVASGRLSVRWPDGHVVDCSADMLRSVSSEIPNTAEAAS